ncbi:retrotransposon ORF1 [Tanacetum coccineum]
MDNINSPPLPKKEKDSDVMLVELIKNNDCPSNEELEEDDDVLGEEEFRGDHFDKFLTRSELAYHKYLMCALISFIILSHPIIVGGNPLNLKIPCNIGHVHVGRANIDLDYPLNIMTRTLHNWIMTNPLKPRKDSKSPSGIRNFTGRVRGIPIFVGNLTYTSDFMIVEDICSVIDPRMSLGILGKPFVELSNMTYDLSLGIVKFINKIEEIAYNIPHKIEQFDSLSDMEKENTKSVYFRNEEDKRRGVEYVMDKILVIMECLVKISKKARILELKRRNTKITVLTTNTLYPARKIRRICACTSQKTTKETRPIRHIQGRPIRRIQAIEIKYSRRYRTWSLLQETPNMPYRSLSICGYFDEEKPGSS